MYTYSTLGTVFDGISLQQSTGTCRFTYRREKIPTESERANQEKYLPVGMEGIKKLAETAHKSKPDKLTT